MNSKNAKKNVTKMTSWKTNELEGFSSFAGFPGMQSETLSTGSELAIHC